MIKDKHPVSKILWEPSESWIKSSNLAKFSRFINRPLTSYASLHHWSVEYPNEFWSAMWDFTKIIGTKGKTIRENTHKGMISTRWFPEARLNFAENLLKGNHSQLAVIEVTEDNLTHKMTYGELEQLVSKAQIGLRNLGVSKGDRVAGIVTNQMEGLIALLAVTALGAVWTSCSPDYGAQGIVDRIGQVKPKILIASLHYQYNGKRYDIQDKIISICEAIGSVSTLITMDGALKKSINEKVNSLQWKEMCASKAELIDFVRVPFNHPLYILYSSGTTGAPKAIIHSVGGTLINHLKEHQLHCDVKPNDRLFWYTNTAWMMYHWLISGLASHATIVLYDGAAIPKDHPDLLWRIADAEQLTHFGTSPKYIDFFIKNNLLPKEEYNLTSLRSVLAAGSPVSPEQFDWVYSSIKKDMMFASISGGTEIVGCLVMGSPISPVRRGEISCKALGMAIDVLDESGSPVMDQKGDLVCTKAFPNMPISFWGEDGDERYYASYFEKHPRIWTHGDLAEQTFEHTVIIYGRTDMTLKPGGVRIGAVEIYRVLEQISYVKDYAIFGLPVDNDEEIVLCLVNTDGKMEQERADEIRQWIRTKASPRHVPKRIYSVREIPYNLNGKKVEGAVRATVLNEPVKNLGSITNVDSLTEYEGLLKRGYL